MAHRIEVAPPSYLGLLASRDNPRTNGASRFLRGNLKVAGGTPALPGTSTLELLLYKLEGSPNNPHIALEASATPIYSRRMAIHKVTKEIHFCYGHRLLNYDGKCKHLHGHNAKAEIEVEATTLDHRGMVMDFGDINVVVKSWIDRELDHKMLLCKDDPMLETLQALNEPCFVLNANPTAENIAKLIYEYAVSQGLQVSEVRLWETPTSFAVYRAG